MIEVTDVQKIGIGLSGMGIAFLFLGVLFLFDKGLLAIGNILFLSGLGCVIGLERTFRFFFQRHKIKGSIAFFGGIFVVLMGFPIIGMIIESYGFFALFSGFFPVAISFLSRIPILGSLFNTPFMEKLVQKLGGDTGRTRFSDFSLKCIVHSN
ncbi:vesicle transport protein GOT1B isoform X1 [Stomoxys calcitrans]|uniref:Vesicle transport protein GOT1B n=1 Tax=Stomoxys calcitrans TaxID=35570 RepID=A0A1I8NT02_STOCA|nr:vesicle transport protein GOT1B isoform X1 [Stomoxys calcitrans]